eukprot:2262699-Pleurochrysis_carterae.AAC.1
MSPKSKLKAHKHGYELDGHSDSARNGRPVVAGSGAEKRSLGDGCRFAWHKVWLDISRIPTASGPWTQWDCRPQRRLPWATCMGVICRKYLSGGIGM